MKKKRFAIIDVETTGGMAKRDKITEIAVVIHDGEQIIDQFDSLVNPGRSIPHQITQLTGITTEMVSEAPYFYEIAKQIVEMTQGCVFVGHNVRFDYSFVQEAFKDLGYTYSRRKLCTVRLARKMFPEFKNYGLDFLTKHFKIDVDRRHRALDDTIATAEIFEKMLSLEDSSETLNLLINEGIKESLLPAAITLDKLHELPEAVGVYYFHDSDGDVIYVGKSINIQKRVMQHFAKTTRKATKLQRLVTDITFELTGSELAALLLESKEIKRLNPPVNIAQKERLYKFAIVEEKPINGYRQFKIQKLHVDLDKAKIVSEYSKLTYAKGHLKRLCLEYSLCYRHCDVDTSKQGPCKLKHLNDCFGACVNEEDVEEYNARFTIAKDYLQNFFQRDFFLIDEGRSNDEKSIFLIKDGKCAGMDYFSTNESVEPAAILDQIQSYPGNAESNRIIRQFIYGKKGLRMHFLNH
ncbi:MAG: exonuclease domain-containing protein [Bacteroidota bacterium]